MGHEFMFFRLTPRPIELPVRPSAGSGYKVEALRSPHEVEELLKQSGRLRPVGAFRDTRFYLWETADGGSLQISVLEQGIYVDAWAHWRYVAELYEQLLPLEPELLINSDSGDFHDARSFAALIEKSYAGKEKRRSDYVPGPLSRAHEKEHADTPCRTNALPNR